MAEGGVEQERKPIDPSLFHIGEESAARAFEELSPQGIHNRAKLDEEKEILKDANPNLVKFIEEYLGLDEGGFPRKDARERYDGYLICYRALRKEAKAQGGVLPKFSKEGLEDYHESEEEGVIKESDAREYSNRDEGALKRGKFRLLKFRNSEPAFSKVIEENFGAIQPWKPDDDPRYQSIIDLCLAVGLGSKVPINLQRAG